MGSVRLASAVAVAFVTAVAAAHGDTVVYSNGFETDTTDWSSVTRVASGTGGVSSADGSYHATATAGSFTRFGGYNYGAGNVPTAFREFTTSVSIFLDTSVGAANDTRFAYTSAVSDSAGGHKRDFVFSVGFLTGGGNHFDISASNNAPGWPSDPGRSPISIAASGWYQFVHHFYDNGGVLAVDMSVVDGFNTTLGTWTLSNPGDFISTVGGNRYGWFHSSGFGSLAIDNALMTVVPLPPAAWAGLGTLAAVGGLRLIRRRRLQA
jgi:hypothetical protein